MSFLRRTMAPQVDYAGLSKRHSGVSTLSRRGKRQRQSLQHRELGPRIAMDRVGGSPGSRLCRINPIGFRRGVCQYTPTERREPMSRTLSNSALDFYCGFNTYGTCQRRHDGSTCCDVMISRKPCCASWQCSRGGIGLMRQLAILRSTSTARPGCAGKQFRLSPPSARPGAQQVHYAYGMRKGRSNVAMRTTQDVSFNTITPIGTKTVDVANTCAGLGPVSRIRLRFADAQ